MCGRCRGYAKISPGCAHCYALTFAERWRGDALKSDRLARSAPCRSWSMADYFGRAMAFQEVAHLHFMELLDLAALYLSCLNTGDSMDEKIGERMFDAARLFGYLLRVKREGWRAFCRDQQIDPDVSWSFLPGFATLQKAERMAAEVAFEPEGATAYWARKYGTSPPKLPTIASEAASLRECLDQQVAWWG